MKCPKCGADSSGKFCAQCGTDLTAGCPSCKAPLLPGSNFCTHCGTRVRKRPLLVPSLIGGVFLAGVAVLLYSLMRVPAAQPDTPVQGAAPPSAGSPPALSGNMRENADRLFNRIMETREQGDTLGAQRFLPMAISAYQNAGELDADGWYHLSIVQSLAGTPAEALESAQRILQDDPTHLLGLHAAAMAARAGNDRATAKTHYQKLLAEFEVEMAKSRPEYVDHGQLVSALPAEARAYLAR